MAPSRPAVPCAGRQARGQAFGLCAGGRQEHAQPAGAQAEARGREVSQDRLRCAEPGSIVRGHLPRWPPASAEGDRARPRRHRRHDPRRARRSVLPWLLRQLLLPAALHLLRPVPARRQAAPRQHRRGRRRGRRGRPDRRPHPGPLAEGADRAARRFGLLPRGADGVVRGRGCRLPVRPGAQRAPEGGAGARGLGGSAVVPNHRQGGSAVQGFRLPDRDLLEPTADDVGLWARPSTCPTVPIRVSW